MTIWKLTSTLLLRLTSLIWCLAAFATMGRLCVFLPRFASRRRRHVCGSGEGPLRVLSRALSNIFVAAATTVLQVEDHILGLFSVVGEWRFCQQRQTFQTTMSDFCRGKDHQHCFKLLLRHIAHVLWWHACLVA